MQVKQTQITALRELAGWDTDGATSGEVRRPRVWRRMTGAVDKTAGWGYLPSSRAMLG